MYVVVADRQGESFPRELLYSDPYFDCYILFWYFLETLKLDIYGFVLLKLLVLFFFFNFLKTLIKYASSCSSSRRSSQLNWIFNTISSPWFGWLLFADTHPTLLHRQSNLAMCFFFLFLFGQLAWVLGWLIGEFSGFVYANRVKWRRYYGVLICLFELVHEKERLHLLSHVCTDNIFRSFDPMILLILLSVWKFHIDALSLF